MTGIIERRSNSISRAMAALVRVEQELYRSCWRASFLEGEVEAAKDQLDLLTEALQKLDTEGVSDG